MGGKKHLMKNNSANKISGISLIPLFLYFLFFSCGTSEFEGYDKAESGLIYKFHQRGTDTVHPKYGEYVRVKMIKRLGDSILENTNQINVFGLRDKLYEPAFKGAVEEGIRMMVIGDSATFLVSTDSINKYFPRRDSSKNLPKGTYLAFDILLFNIQTKEEILWEEEQKRKEQADQRKLLEPEEIKRYVDDLHIDVKPTPSGLYFWETTKGTGRSPRDGDTVVVHYTGSFLNGVIFDSSIKRNEPFSFVVNDKGMYGVIPGWDEAIKKMKKGSVATIVLPSSLAYGEAGKDKIPPYCPLKFDIQLLEIK